MNNFKNTGAHIAVRIYAFGSWSGFCFHDNGGPVQCCGKNCLISCIFNIEKKQLYIEEALTVYKVIKFLNI